MKKLFPTKGYRRFIYFGLVPSLLLGTAAYFIGRALSDRQEATALFSPSPEQTYSEALKSQGLKTVDRATSEDDLKNVILSRMFPNYKSPHTYRENQLFKGSPHLVLNGSDIAVGKPKLFVIEKSEGNDVRKFKDSCIHALDQKTDSSTNEFYRLKEWCTVPKIKDVLKRHKFKLAGSDDKWRQIISSDWFGPQYRNKQSFLSGEEMSGWDSKKEQEKINLLKNKCAVALEQTFTRNNFPAPKALLDSLDKRVDEFQEVALFCVEPKSAKDYVSEAMQGSVNISIPHYMKNDFCYVSGYDSISNYENIKTIDPMSGKSFWCAVRMIYGKHKSNSSR